MPDSFYTVAGRTDFVVKQKTTSEFYSRVLEYSVRTTEKFGSIAGLTALNQFYKIFCVMED